MSIVRRPNRFLVSAVALALLGGTASVVRATEPAPRVVAVRVSGRGFEPATISARAAERLDLVFTRQPGPTCATSVVFPTLNLTRELPEGQPVRVAVTAPERGALVFHCSYGHLRGEVRVP